MDSHLIFKINSGTKKELLKNRLQLKTKIEKKVKDYALASLALGLKLL